MAEPTEPAATATEPTGNPQGTGEAAPSGQPGQSSGQPVSTEGAPAAPQGTGSQPAEETFFDPSSLSEELKPAYKQMQRAFTEKTQDIKKQRQKVQAYDEFMRNPVQNLQRMAQQYGYQFVPAGQQSNQQPSGNGDLSNWQPQNWAEVLQKAKDMAKEELRGEYQQQIEPVLGEVRNLRKSQLEKTLDDAVPEWRQYEDEMSQALQDHPTLVNDPLKLARIAIPEEVQQSKAMQQAMRKLQDKSASAQPSGGSSTRRQPPENPKPKSFDEAVSWAKKEIAAGRGIMGKKG